MIERRFVFVGARASASAGFLLVDLPGTSGRLDVLLRCMRAALLVSHGLRRDTVVYLVLLGGPEAPRTLRVDGAAVKFLRPDERSLAVLAQKALSDPRQGDGFVEVRPGVSVARGGVETALGDLGACALYLLEEGGAELRGEVFAAGRVAFFVGDHSGFDAPTLAALEARGARRVSVGPVSIHAEDAVAVVCNELDRSASATAR